MTDSKPASAAAASAAAASLNALTTAAISLSVSPYSTVFKLKDLSNLHHVP